VKKAPSSAFKCETDTADTHRREVRDMFDVVAPRYDLMNDVMSMGIHRLWKRKCVNLLSPENGEIVVDLAGGTGDLARKFSARGAQAIVCDPCYAMMAATKQSEHPFLHVAGYGEKLPFADKSIDALSISFGLRNMSDPQAGLAEIYRVLKPGGRFLCLEFSHAQAWLKPFYDAYSLHIIPLLGAAIAGEKSAYTYLVRSIREFPNQEDLAIYMKQVGFTNVEYTNLSFGIAAIHQGKKA
jgi:demethylmenaquinone methyltransferase / 2-methoxy-6-polyprenyl-1,4-benzoquinol methylase